MPAAPRIRACMENLPSGCAASGHQVEGAAEEVAAAEIAGFQGEQHRLAAVRRCAGPARPAAISGPSRKAVEARAGRPLRRRSRRRRPRAGARRGRPGLRRWGQRRLDGVAGAVAAVARPGARAPPRAGAAEAISTGPAASRSLRPGQAASPSAVGAGEQPLGVEAAAPASAPRPRAIWPSVACEQLPARQAAWPPTGSPSPPRRPASGVPRPARDQGAGEAEAEARRRPPRRGAPSAARPRISRSAVEDRVRDGRAVPSAARASRRAATASAPRATVAISTSPTGRRALAAEHAHEVGVPHRVERDGPSAGSRSAAPRRRRGCPGRRCAPSPGRRG